LALQKLAFRPGIVKDATRYSGEGNWFDCDKVRFVNGLPQKLGGWVKVSSTGFSGVCRSLFNWSTLAGRDFLSLGTSTKLLIEEGGAISNVTPLRTSNITLGSNPIKTNTAGTGEVTVTHASHGAIVDDTVIMTGAATVDGVTDVQLNTSHAITAVVDSNSYKFVTAGSSSSGNTAGGGSSVIVSYEINTGPAEAGSDGLGFGAGFWGGTRSGATTTTLASGINNSVTTIPLTSATGFDTAATTISANIDAVVGLINVASTTGFPAVGIVKIGSEEMYYTSVKSSTALSGITRGYNGTTAASHSSGASATYVGTLVIDEEIITYTGVSTNSLTGAQRGQLATTAAAHDSGATATESFNFVGWGSVIPSSEEVATESATTVRMWKQDNFGEDLLANIYGGSLYFWDTSDGFSNRAVELSSLDGSSDCPTSARVVLVSDNDRHVLAFACNDITTGDVDPLLIRWGDQESLTNWTPATTNTAGDLRINNGSEIITAVETRQEVLVWTDRSLHSLRFVGSPFVFGQTMISQNVTIVGPNAVTAMGDAVFWMGNNTFYTYNGRVSTLPCPVRNFIFQDLNFSERDKFFAATNYEFNEVMFFYVSVGSEDVNKYVIYNIQDQVWYTGTLPRTAWIDRSIREFPIAVSPDGYIFQHDDGLDDGSETPAVGMNSFIESSDFEIGEGDRFQFISRIIPDLSFNGSSVDAPSVSFSLKPRNFPGSAFGTSGSASVSASQTVDVEQFTDQAFVRLRSREMAVRVSSDDAGVFWRLGTPRIDVRKDGRR
tara:strand:+ start:7593 stop:9923 length:2331 start_codon:yes stop_codon:yes gene_type:complete